MYAPGYGYGAGNSAHHQAGGQHHQQHMTYNHQQYAGAHYQQPYGAAMPGPPSASAVGGVGGLGRMHNGGMTHMGEGNGSYQTPYANASSGNVMPTSSGSFPTTYMPAMNSNMINPQMQPPTTTPTPVQTGARHSPYGNIQNKTPSNTSSVQYQQSNQTRALTPSNHGQIQSGGTVTPQTPNFPPEAQTPHPGPILAQPMSPLSESREKERVTLLLEINKELFQEVVYLQAAQMKFKMNGGDAKEDFNQPNEGYNAETGMALKEQLSKAYIDTMRRLHSNLAYLAAIADRPNKPASQIPPHPALLSAPLLPARYAAPRVRNSALIKDATDTTSPPEEAESRAVLLQDHYRKLQALFPGVDPNKEPQATRNPAPQQQKLGMSNGNGGMNGNGNGVAYSNPEQQKMQNEMRRRMMMQEHAQKQAQQRAGMALAGQVGR